MYLADGNGIGFSFSNWSFHEDELRQAGAGPIFPTGSAHVGILVDFHYEEIAVDSDLAASGDMTEIGADLQMFTSDGPRYYKSGETEPLAHYETRYDDRTQTAIVVNGRTYLAHRKRRRFLPDQTTITEGRSVVAQFRHGLFSDSGKFCVDLSLRERLFIGLMQIDWDPDSEITPEQGPKRAIGERILDEWLQHDGFDGPRFMRLSDLRASFENGEINEEEFKQEAARIPET